MRQAIETKFLGPTDRRGSRVKASADAGSITLDWDHRLNSDANHRAAALAFARKFGWKGVWSGGSIKGSGYVFVTSDSDDFIV